MDTNLTERVERLERENRIWRRSGVAVALVGSIVLLTGGVKPVDRPKEVEAEQFTLKDKNGKTRAVLGMSPGSDPVLLFLNKENEITFKIPWYAWDERKYGPFVPSTNPLGPQEGQ